MRNALALAACGLLFFSAGLAAQGTRPAKQRSSYTDVTYGYSLDSPLFPKGANQSVVPVVFSGPPLNGSAPNVNVNVQFVATTRKGYRELSLGQMKQLGFKINEDRDVTVSGHEAMRLDYEGAVQGRDFHFLALAVIEKDRVILVTATASPEGFPAVESEFRACLDSFRMK